MTVKDEFGWLGMQSAKKSSQPTWTASSTQVSHPLAEVPGKERATKPVALPLAHVASNNTDLASKNTHPSPAAAALLDQMAESEELEIAAANRAPTSKMEVANETKASAKKIQANRENAKKSTGPITARGKSFSSMNARKHDFFSQVVVIKDRDGKETQGEFDQLHEEIREYFVPEDYWEAMLVEILAVNRWTMRRVLRCENAEINNQFRNGRISPKGVISSLLEASQTDKEKRQEALEGPASVDLSASRRTLIVSCDT